MYKIFFGQRFIALQSSIDNNLNQDSGVNIICKNKKSFDNAYNDFVINENIIHYNIINPKPNKLFAHLIKKFRLIKAAGGLVENNEGKILLMKRDDVWDLPKGKIEKKERKKNAATREVEEECGIHGLQIKSKIGKTYHTYTLKDKQFLKITHWYSMLYKGDETPVPQIEEGISELKWIAKNEINQYINLCHPNLRSILETKL